MGLASTGYPFFARRFSLSSGASPPILTLALAPPGATGLPLESKDARLAPWLSAEHELLADSFKASGFTGG